MLNRIADKLTQLMWFSGFMACVITALSFIAFSFPKIGVNVENTSITMVMIIGAYVFWRLFRKTIRS